MIRETRLGFSQSEEWKIFSARHAMFLDRLTNLVMAENVAFGRTADVPSHADKAVFVLGNLCAEDFSAIVMLCSEGLGESAQVILRTMYERAVTARYLHLHPEEAESFFDFFWMSLHKISGAGEELMQKEKELFTAIETNYKRVRARFLVVDCKKCGTTRPNYTWSKLDFVSMARSVGTLGDLLVPAYYLPMFHAHASAQAIATTSVSLVKSREPTERPLIEPRRQEEIDQTLMTAHDILLDILKLQREHFGIHDLGTPLEKCVADFEEIWLPQTFRLRQLSEVLEQILQSVGPTRLQ